MQKQAFLHPGWCFPPERVVLGASHGVTGTFIGTDPAAKSNLAHGHTVLVLPFCFFCQLDAKVPDFFVPCSQVHSPYLGIYSPTLAQGCRIVPPARQPV
jgi:hypothetical protein